MRRPVRRHRPGGLSACLPPGPRNRCCGCPVVRGVVALYESMSLGIKALGLSANISLEGLDAEAAAAMPRSAATSSADLAAEGFASESGDRHGQAPALAGKWPSSRPRSAGSSWPSRSAIALVMAVGLFVVVPLVVVKQFEDTFANPFVFNLVEGLIRIAIFILYLVGI